MCIQSAEFNPQHHSEKRVMTNKKLDANQISINNKNMLNTICATLTKVKKGEAMTWNTLKKGALMKVNNTNIQQKRKEIRREIKE